MCDSFKEPHLPMSFKMADCNCDHTLSHCVTVPGDSEKTQCWGYLRHSPDSSSSSFSCHSHWEMARPAATGHSRKLWHGGMLAGQEKLPHCSTKPIFTKYTLWVTRFSMVHEVKPWWKLWDLSQTLCLILFMAWISFVVFTLCYHIFLYIFSLLVVEPTFPNWYSRRLHMHKGFTGNNAGCNPSLLFTIWSHWYQWLLTAIFHQKCTYKIWHDCIFFTED